MTITLIKLRVIGIFISSLLFYNCSSNLELENKTIFVFKENRKINKERNSKVFYEATKDTLFLRASNPFWGENILKYKILSRKEKDNMESILKDLDFLDLKKSYDSKSHDITYQYEIEVFENKNKVDFKTVIYSEEFPNELRKLINFFNNISKNSFKELKIENSFLSDLKFNRLIKEKDTLSFSNYNNYFLWKGLNTINNRLEKNTFKKDYIILFEYPFNYSGKRIENLTTDNLQDFYYEFEGKHYSFQLDAPLQIDR